MAEATQPKPSQQPEPRQTALGLLLQSDGAEDTKEIVNAMLKSGMVLSTSEVRRYLQASGKKVARVADGILAIGVNVAFLRTLARAVQNTGPKVGIGDAMRIVEKEYGVSIPAEVISILELASS
jgi:hypothetical protein